MENDILKDYKERIVPALKEKLGYENIHQVPRIEKVTVNCCVGREGDRKQAVEDALEEIARITGQKPVATLSKLAVSNFKLRKGEAIGAKVTLRGKAMYEFLLRLIRIAIPSIRDFRGVSPKAFDGRGNYTLGITDQTIFPEVDLDKVKRQLGFDITIVTSANNNNDALELLKMMGMPFRAAGGSQQSEAEAA
ncbi:MAG: 50S ribosomal protein L5 [Verrucomicrobiales bacterium]